MTFYDRFAELCRDNNISPSSAAMAVGLNRSSVTRWKQKGTSPRQETVVKIANMFDVTVEYMMGLENLKYRPHVTSADVKLYLFGPRASDKMWKEVLKFVEKLKAERGSDDGM
ncbi:MAG: helix-turn-helix transcriptional regulator [Clostridia bacterium]|nr:helix-turn-helix transcriptional regulator [Clostridia bacterium]